MSGSKLGTKAWLLSSALLLSCPSLAFSAQTSQSAKHRPQATTASASAQAHGTSKHATTEMSARGTRTASLNGKHVTTGRYHGISCVPYARQITEMAVAGNAWQWWGNAAGLYARGDRPEAGSILNFRANGRMRLGHVAVVTRVINARDVLVDHANWAGGGIARDVAVVDVSEANNWSAVRVELGRGETFGSVYPTYGFIYNRPDSGSGVVMASATRPAPIPAINAAPSDLRPVAERPWRTVEEVAEAPARTTRRIDLRVAGTNGR